MELFSWESLRVWHNQRTEQVYLFCQTRRTIYRVFTNIHKGGGGGLVVVYVSLIQIWR